MKQRLMRASSPALQIGKAAEHLVCADLLISGRNAFLADQGLPYDVVVDVDGRLVRVQVKSTQIPKKPQTQRATPAYFFHIRRAGRKGARVYGTNEFDVYALVALDRRLIGYFSKDGFPRSYLAIRVPGLNYGQGGRSAREFGSATFDSAVQTRAPAASVAA